MGGSLPGVIKIWDLKNDCEYLHHELKYGWYPRGMVAFNPRGNLLLIGSDMSGAKILDLEEKKEAYSDLNHSSYLQFCECGESFVSVDRDKETVQVFQTTEFGQGEDRHERLCFNDSSSFEANRFNLLKRIQVFDLPSNVSLKLSQNEKYVASSSGQLCLLETGDIILADKSKIRIDKVLFNSEANLVCFSHEDDQVIVYDIEKETEIARYKHDRGCLKTFVGNQITSVSYNGDVKIFDCSKGEFIFDKNFGKFKSIMMSGHENFIVCKRKNKTFFVFDIKKRETKNIEKYIGENKVSYVKFSPCGKFLTLECDDTKCYAKILSSMSFSLETRGQKEIKVIDLKTGDCLVRQKGTYLSFGFAPNGRCFAAAGSGKITVYDLQEKNNIRKICYSHINDASRNIDLLFKGNYILSTSFKSGFIIFDAKRGKEVFRYDRRKDRICKFDVIGDGDGFIVGTVDGHVLVFDHKGHKLFHYGHGDDINVLTCTQDRKKLISGSYNGDIKVWEMPDQWKGVSLFGKPKKDASENIYI